jgi:hypothetical protein
MDDAQIKLRYLRVNFIGLALIGSVFLYAAVVEVLKRVLAPFPGFVALSPPQAQMMKYLFIALALPNFFLIKFFQRILGSNSVAQLVQGAIVSFALSEAVAIFGLMLFLINGNAMDFYTFMFLSLFYFWFFFPKIKDWEARLQVPPDTGAN